jgi:hypothetical protein
MKHIKHLDEFFDPGVFGDSPGYGGANGVFRVSYKPFHDLSVSVGPDPNVPRIIQGAQYQVGDLVIGIPVDKKDKVAGMIVKSYLAPDSKTYCYDVMVQSIGHEDHKVVELNPETIQFIDQGDKGHKEILNKYSIANLPGSIYNLPTVFNDPELGIERISP